MARHLRLPLAVCVGGGTGQPQVLRALRGRGWDLAAVVAMADDGGSTGAIRRAMDAVPPGDVRNCLIALAADPDSPLARSFQRRLPVAANHPLGNLMLATLADESGSFPSDTSIHPRPRMSRSRASRAMAGASLARR